MDRTPDIIESLALSIQEPAVQLVTAARHTGWPLIITSGRRTPHEQRSLVERGVSRTLDSAHLTGHAFDVDLLGWRRDDVPAWLWRALGPFGESLGLTWGGRWRAPYDPGHFELRSRDWRGILSGNVGTETDW